MSQSPLRSAEKAWAIATSEVEQAVWTLIAGPVRLSRWATRVAMKSLSLASATGSSPSCSIRSGRLSR